jgi:hypothetical protein
MSTSQESRYVKELPNSIQGRLFKSWNMIAIEFLLKFPGPTSELFYIILYYCRLPVFSTSMQNISNFVI